ncbi:MAG: 50S ribosomal protein L6 [Candidatus Aenigmarchaeota archaeon]|nr:50S ribosomal protein L6 [Candidatus Aenigmarchaeota archaeon]
MYSREISIPEGVSIDVDGTKMKVSGTKGELKREFKLTYGAKITKEDSKIKVTSEIDRRKAKALVGTVIAHTRNMIRGVTKGYTYRLKIVYSHFPMTAKVEGKKVMVSNFIGERTSRIAKIVGNTQVKIEGQDVTVTGNDPEETGQTAGNIELACRIVGYDKRRFADGIFITGKE